MPQSAPRATAEMLPPGLYVIATPIGNLRDITQRALELLPQMDVLACEDTRTTYQLLQAFGLRAPELVAYHEHNADAQRPKLLARLHEGARIGVVSEAGTPLISDPGYRLVAAATQENIRITPIVGACAPIAALMAAGLPTEQFHFAGFLPTKDGARAQAISAVAATPGTLVFFESPRRLADTMPALASILGETRQACVAREITKHFEEFRRGTLAELAAHYAAADAPKGEVVVVVGPAPEAPAQPDASFSPSEEWEALAEAALKGGMPASQLASLMAEALSAPRKPVYAWVMACKARTENT